MLGDGHNNTATAAEALGVTTNHGVPLRYTEKHDTRTQSCRDNLRKVIQQMDTLDAAHPTLELSKLPDYQKANTEIADCDLALSDPTRYLAVRGFRVVSGDFQ